MRQTPTGFPLPTLAALAGQHAVVTFTVPRTLVTVLGLTCDCATRPLASEVPTCRVARFALAPAVAVTISTYSVKSVSQLVAWIRASSSRYPFASSSACACICATSTVLFHLTSDLVNTPWVTTAACARSR